MKFHDSFFVTGTHVPAVETISPQGSPIVGYPGPGVSIRVSVQSRQVMRLDETGRVISATRYEVFLRDNPSGLNGGRGIRQDDAIDWNGLRLVAVGDAVSECSPGTLPVWRVECTAKV